MNQNKQKSHHTGSRVTHSMVLQLMKQVAWMTGVEETDDLKKLIAMMPIDESKKAMLINRVKNRRIKQCLRA